MRQLNDAPCVIAYGRHITHFRCRKQTFIFGVVVGNSMQKVDVRDRWQALDLEVAEAPEMQPLADHGMHSALQPFPLVPSVSWTIGKVLHAAYALTLARTSNSYHDAPDRTRKRNLIQHRPHFHLCRVRGAYRAVGADVKIQDD